MHLRLKVLTFGASIAGLGAFALVSAARLQVIGVRSTATFIEYTDVCSLDDPSVGLFESIRPFNCDESDTRRRPGVGLLETPAYTSSTGWLTTTSAMPGVGDRVSAIRTWTEDSSSRSSTIRLSRMMFGSIHHL
jgi:hypothetical protein